MKAIAVLCIVLSAPLSILAAAIYPTVRDTPALAGGVLVGALIAFVAIGALLANAVENGVTGAMAARGIQAATGNYPPAPDVLEIPARMARIDVDRARASQLRGSTPGALPAPMFVGQVESVAQWDEHVGGWER